MRPLKSHFRDDALTTLIGSWTKRPSSTARSTRHGVVRHSPPSEPARLASSLAVRACAVSEKKRGKLWSTARASRSPSRGPRLGFAPTRRPRVPGSPGRAPLTLRRRNDPLALCAPQARLVAPGPTLSPADPSAEPAPEQPGGIPQTPSVGTRSLLEPSHQGRVAQRHWRRPVWPLQSLLYNCAAL
jgi:hypothetical protein